MSGPPSSGRDQTEEARRGTVAAFRRWLAGFPAFAAASASRWHGCLGPDDSPVIASGDVPTHSEAKRSRLPRVKGKGEDSAGAGRKVKLSTPFLASGFAMFTSTIPRYAVRAALATSQAQQATTISWPHA
jgi:hypothetical protein